MRTKAIFAGLSILASLCIIFGFSNKPNKDRTGEFVFIPQGSFSLQGKTYSIDAYWMAEHEVTNKEYKTFLNELKKNDKMEEYSLCLPDSNRWNSDLSKKNSAFAQFYHWQSAFEYYPVVNISYEAAELYCKWLTDNNEEEEVYRLPSKLEWIYGARGGFDLNDYSWLTPHLYDKKGQARCNFKEIGDHLIHLDSNNVLTIISNDDLFQRPNIPSPVDTYEPNEWGLYNVNGNVAEMIQDKGIAMGGSFNDVGYDVRCTSEKTYLQTSPTVGFRVLKEYKGK